MERSGIKRNCAITSQRLGVVAAPTELPAGYKVSNLHCRVRGVTAAITPNRPLTAGVCTAFSFFLYS